MYDVYIILYKNIDSVLGLWSGMLRKCERNDFMKKLSKKEKAFCKSFLDTGSISQAEKMSGVKDGNKLIDDNDVIQEIDRLSKIQRQGLNVLAKAGLKRLAMGSISDAVSLIYMDKPDREKLRDMDLFMISEIRRKEDGNMEIKFFDRFKALDKLMESDEKNDSGVAFYDALMLGAKSVEGTVNGD